MSMPAVLTYLKKKLPLLLYWRQLDATRTYTNGRPVKFFTQADLLKSLQSDPGYADAGENIN